MQPLSDVFSRWSSGCLRCIAVLVYAAPMRKPTIHRLLSFLLACVLLAQTAVGVAGWHVDFPLMNTSPCIAQHWNNTMPPTMQGNRIA